MKQKQTSIILLSLFLIFNIFVGNIIANEDFDTNIEYNLEELNEKYTNDELTEEELEKLEKELIKEQIKKEQELLEEIKKEKNQNDLISTNNSDNTLVLDNEEDGYKKYTTKYRSSLFNLNASNRFSGGEEYFNDVNNGTYNSSNKTVSGSKSGDAYEYITSYSDGTKTIERTDGTYEAYYSDGSKFKDWGDGTSVAEDVGGRQVWDISEKKPDGKVEKTQYVAETDGSYTLDNNDVVIGYDSSSGETVIYDKNSKDVSHFDKNGKETTFHENGDVSTFDSENGNQITKKVNGDTVTTIKDPKDGEAVTTTEKRNGDIVETFKNGNTKTTTENDDGSKIIQHYDAEINETRVEKVPAEINETVVEKIPAEINETAVEELQENERPEVPQSNNNNTNNSSSNTSSNNSGDNKIGTIITENENVTVDGKNLRNIIDKQLLGTNKDGELLSLPLYIATILLTIFREYLVVFLGLIVGLMAWQKIQGEQWKRVLTNGIGSGALLLGAVFLTEGDINKNSGMIDKMQENSFYLVKAEREFIKLGEDLADQLWMTIIFGEDYLKKEKYEEDRLKSTVPNTVEKGYFVQKYKLLQAQIEKDAERNDRTNIDYFDELNKQWEIKNNIDKSNIMNLLFFPSIANIDVLGMDTDPETFKGIIKELNKGDRDSKLLKKDIVKMWSILNKNKYLDENKVNKDLFEKFYPKQKELHFNPISKNFLIKVNIDFIGEKKQEYYIPEFLWFTDSQSNEFLKPYENILLNYHDNFHTKEELFYAYIISHAYVHNWYLNELQINSIYNHEVEEIMSKSDHITHIVTKDNNIDLKIEELKAKAKGLFDFDYEEYIELYGGNNKRKEIENNIKLLKNTIKEMAVNKALRIKSQCNLNFKTITVDKEEKYIISLNGKSIIKHDDTFGNYNLNDFVSNCLAYSNNKIEIFSYSTSFGRIVGTDAYIQGMENSLPKFLLNVPVHIVQQNEKIGEIMPKTIENIYVKTIQENDPIINIKNYKDISLLGRLFESNNDEDTSNIVTIPSKYQKIFEAYQNNLDKFFILPQALPEIQLNYTSRTINYKAHQDKIKDYFIKNNNSDTQSIYKNAKYLRDLMDKDTQIENLQEKLNPLMLTNRFKKGEENPKNKNKQLISWMELGSIMGDLKDIYSPYIIYSLIDMNDEIYYQKQIEIAKKINTDNSTETILEKTREAAFYAGLIKGVLEAGSSFAKEVGSGGPRSWMQGLYFLTTNAISIAFKAGLYVIVSQLLLVAVIYLLPSIFWMLAVLSWYLKTAVILAVLPLATFMLSFVNFQQIKQMILTLIALLLTPVVLVAMFFIILEILSILPILIDKFLPILSSVDSITNYTSNTDGTGSGMQYMAEGTLRMIETMVSVTFLIKLFIQLIVSTILYSYFLKSSEYIQMIIGHSVTIGGEAEGAASKIQQNFKMNV